ncbi:MAG: PQQ-like beta-propeller repeat protein, partial [Verrucomicrobia bacterium]|nr:PQQ-like beta-propeller repeat protein [Verrucomicrobiota bacterium]
MRNLALLIVLVGLVAVVGTSDAKAPGSVWPNIFGNSQQTSTYSGGATGGIIPYVKWSSWSDGPGYWAGPVLDDADNIYIVANEAEASEEGWTNWRGSLRKYDSDGNLQWSISTPSVLTPYNPGWDNWSAMSTTGCVSDDGFWYVPTPNDGTDGALLKIDTATGDIIWMHIFGAGGVAVDRSCAVMDDFGDIYVETADSVLRKIVDNGATASEVWAQQVSTAGRGWMNAAAPAISPNSAKVYRNASDPAYPYFAIKAFDATNGDVIWSVALGGDAEDPWNPPKHGQIIVDDADDLYLYMQVPESDDVTAGVVKIDGDTGDTEWIWYIPTGENSLVVEVPCTGALSADEGQAVLYMSGDRAGGTATYAIDTATGVGLWTFVAAQSSATGQTILDAAGNPVNVGGDGSWVWSMTDEGDHAILTWQALELPQASGGTYLIPGQGDRLISQAHAMTSVGELVYATHGPGWQGGDLLVELHANNPPLDIILPVEIGPLEKDIPIYGDFPYGMGLAMACKGIQGPVTYSVYSGAFPPGVHLSDDGYIRGTPTATGQYTVEIEAYDTVLTARKTYVIDVNMAALQIGPGLPLASVGHAYDGELWIIGGEPPYTVAVTAGKGDGGTGDGTLGTTGLTLNSDGSVTGTPTEIGSATVEITVTDSAEEPATVTRDITVDAVDSRVWDTIQRTKRRVGTATLPAPMTYPHNVNGEGPDGRGFQYNPRDTWQWAYEMLHAPLFANLHKDPDDDGVNNGYMFIQCLYSGNPAESGYTGSSRWAAVPYDVDPGGRYPDPGTATDCWTYNLGTAGWLLTSGRYNIDPMPGVLSIEASEDPKAAACADRLYFATRLPSLYYDSNRAALGCLNAETGTLMWTFQQDLTYYLANGLQGEACPMVQYRGPKAILENGHLLTMGHGWKFLYYDPRVEFPPRPIGTNDLNWQFVANDQARYRRTYMVMEDAGSIGNVVWVAGEENTSARMRKGPFFGAIEESNQSGFFSVMKLADEGEMVLVQNYNIIDYPAEAFVIRADRVGPALDKATLWTIGCGFDNWTPDRWGYHPSSWPSSAPRAFPVVDSTNNVYVTKTSWRWPNDAYGELNAPGIFQIDAVEATDYPETPDHSPTSFPSWQQWGWPYVNSDRSIRWFTVLGGRLTHGIPGSPCLSRDQRTLYTVVTRAAADSGDNIIPLDVVNVPHPQDPTQTTMLVALNTLNGSVKWIEELVDEQGRSGYDHFSDSIRRNYIGPRDLQANALLADSAGKVIFTTNGDKRSWWDDPDNVQGTNPQGPEWDTALRPMIWCFQDTGTDGDLLWTRALNTIEPVRNVTDGYEVGGCSFVVAPNYRLIFGGSLDPEWTDPEGFTDDMGWWMLGVHVIHPDDIEITDVYWDQVAK